MIYYGFDCSVTASKFFYRRHSKKRRFFITAFVIKSGPQMVRSVWPQFDGNFEQSKRRHSLIYAMNYASVALGKSIFLCSTCVMFRQAMDLFSLEKQDVDGNMSLHEGKLNEKMIVVL